METVFDGPSNACFSEWQRLAANGSDWQQMNADYAKQLSAEEASGRSALVAHFAVGDGPEAWGWAAAAGVLWGLSYYFWRRLQAAPARR